MVKIEIKYETEQEKDVFINLINKNINVKKISKPYKSGKFNRVYLDVDLRNDLVS